MEFLLRPWVGILAIFVVSGGIIAFTKNLWPLYRKETNSVLLSPIIYIFTAVFLVVTGFFFNFYVAEVKQASMRMTFSNVSIILLFFAPAITMRLFAEETRSGTIETLMTAPVTDVQVVLGKFFAGWTFYCIMLLPTLAYVGILARVSAGVGLDYGPIMAGYLGLILMGGLFVSLGLFLSSLTRNQIVAFAITLAVFLLLWVIGMAGRNKTGIGNQILAYLGMFEHIEDFIKGLVDTRDIVYYLSATVFGLFLTVRSVESRKWR
jgi:ABC-2 type transport system permease protein